MKYPIGNSTAKSTASFGEIAAKRTVGMSQATMAIPGSMMKAIHRANKLAFFPRASVPRYSLHHAQKNMSGMTSL
jgi:hypothetical protein